MQGHGAGGGHLLGAAAPGVDQSGGGHAGGGANLRLTAPLGPGDGGPGGDDLAEPGGHIQALHHGVGGQALPLPQGKEDGGHHPAGSGGGGGHNAAHTGVVLTHLEGGGDDLLHVRPAQGVLGLGHLFALTAGQAGGRAALGVVVLHGLHHGLPQGLHAGKALLLGDVPVLAVVQQHRLPQGLVLGAVYQMFHGLKSHISSPPY